MAGGTGKIIVRCPTALAMQATRAELWAMPALQVGWLAFFLADAVHKFWYNWGLLVPCFITGAGLSRPG